jgi:hypothetical protein
MTPGAVGDSGGVETGMTKSGAERYPLDRADAQ